MSNIPPKVPSPPIQSQETIFKAAVAEYTMTRVGAAINQILGNVLAIAKFNLNGNVSSFVGVPGADGIFVVPWNAYITDAIIIGGRTAGTSGTTEMDVQLSVAPNGAWATIFSTIPALAPAAATFASCGVNDTVTGATPGVLLTPTTGVSVAKGDRIRLNVASAMGSQLDGSMEVHFKMR